MHFMYFIDVDTYTWHNELPYTYYKSRGCSMFVADRDHLAIRLDVPIKKLTYLLYVIKTENCYTSFEIPKKDGTSRIISTPNDELKDVQRRLANLLYEKQRQIWKKQNLSPNISHGFEKKKSIITNAKIHRNKRFVLNIDLESFFDSFHFGRVRGYFHKNRNFELDIDTATVIAQLTCYNGSLPQGAPTSPIITNLICQILDFRLLNTAKKYKLDYTRYADDLTFSTNNKHFMKSNKDFIKEISKVVEKAGFKINERKSKLQYRDSKQTVTGLVVNKKINVDKKYFRTTKAMAHSLYTKGKFLIDGEEGTIDQLEGRFSFINRLDKYDNLTSNNKMRNAHTLNERERQYQRFLFFKYFWCSQKPVIVTEGKTDIFYLKAALKNCYEKFPQIIEKKSNGTYEYKVGFFHKTKRMKYFFNIVKDGADTINQIYYHYTGSNNCINYCEIFKKYNSIPANPIILLFDNEIERNNNKPICKFTGYTKLNVENKNTFKTQLKIKLLNDANLHLITNPIIGDKSECELEDLFDKETYEHIINGKTFSPKENYSIDKHYGKEIFSKYIYSNYDKIDFSNFLPILNNINDIVMEYK